jgi:hypothetical protein
MAEQGLGEGPVRICCGQSHWTVTCPDGRVMCCICFSRFEKEDLYVDATNTTWDVCQGCAPQVGD